MGDEQKLNKKNTVCLYLRYIYITKTHIHNPCISTKTYIYIYIYTDSYMNTQTHTRTYKCRDNPNDKYNNYFIKYELNYQYILKLD